MLFLLMLPLRLFVGLLLLPFVLLFLPFLLLRFVIKTVFLVVALPFVLLAIGGALLAALVVVLFAVMIPLLPLAFLALFIWAVVRLTSRPSLSNSAPTRSSPAATAFPG